MVYVTGPRETIVSAEVIDTTSRSRNWNIGLSPFHLGPVLLYGDYRSENVENAWQFSKVYMQHVDPETQEPTQEYFSWAQKGWKDKRAHRYPMGKGAVPEYSYWDGGRYGYIEARKLIYAPLYMSAVVRTRAFRKLQEIHQKSDDIFLWDFDGYNHRALGMTLKDVINEPKRKMGHAFVLAMLLELDKSEILELLDV